MAGLYSAIEHIVNTPKSGIPESIDEMMVLELQIQETEAELAATEAELAVFNTEDFVTSLSFEMLEKVQNVIERDGICKGYVEIVDPDGTMQEAGLLPSIENLNEVPTKDEYATMAVEGIKEVLKKAWEAIKNFFNKIWNYVKKAFDSFINLFKTKEKLIKKLIDDLGNVSELDEEKLEKIKVTYFKDEVKGAITNIESTLKTAMGKIDNFAKELNNIEKATSEQAASGVEANILNALPLKINQVTASDLSSNNEYSYEGNLDSVEKVILGKEKVKVKAKVGSLDITYSGEYDMWEKDKKLEDIVKSPSDMKDNLKGALEIVKTIKIIEAGKKAGDSVIKAIMKVAKQVEKMEENDSKFPTKVASVAKKVYSENTKFNMACIKFLNKYVDLQIKLAKGMLSAKK